MKSFFLESDGFLICSIAHNRRSSGDVVMPKDTSSTMIVMKAVFAGLEKPGRFGTEADDV